MDKTARLYNIREAGSNDPASPFGYISVFQFED